MRERSLVKFQGQVSAICARGGIGRHMRFKPSRPKRHASSSLAERTNIEGPFRMVVSSNAESNINLGYYIISK